MQAKAVFFDLGGTLIKTLEIAEIYKKILANFGVQISADDVEKAHKANEEKSNVTKGLIEMGSGFWTKWNLEVLERIGIQEDKEFLARKINELWWEYSGLEIHEDVMETLFQLKSKGVKVGVITNALKSEGEIILRKLGLEDCFDVVVGIDVCNSAKPDKEIFHYAIEKLGARSDEAIFVGDSVIYDYEGAKKAGLKALLIDREGKASKELDSIRSLTDVLDYF